jgi:hypothetical protein
MPVELMSAIDEASATSSSANRLVAEEDALLVAAAKARDTRAFELLVERHERKIFSTAQRITRNREDAEDVVYLRAAELLQFGLPFDANQAQELGFVTRVVPDQRLLWTATDTAQKLAEKLATALQASKRLMKKPRRDALLEAAKAENSEFSVRVRSADSKEAITAFFEKRPPDFTWSRRAEVA